MDAETKKCCPDPKHTTSQSFNPVAESIWRFAMTENMIEIADPNKPIRFKDITGT